MSKYDRNYSRYQGHSQKHSYPKYKVIFDSNQDERKGSRSRSRARSSSPKILFAILDGHISENLEVIDKNYKSTVDSFKIIAEKIRDPYDFTIIPALIPSTDISELVESSRRLRSDTKDVNFSLSDAKLNLIIARLKSHECDAKLAAVKEQLAAYST